MARRGRNRQRGRGARGGRATELPSSSPEDSSDSEPPIPSRRGRSRRGATNASTRGRGDHTRRGGRQRSSQNRQSPAASTQVTPARITPSMMNYMQRQNTQFRKKLWEVWGIWARQVGLSTDEDNMDWQPEAERVILMEFRRESEMRQIAAEAWYLGFQEGMRAGRLQTPAVIQARLFPESDPYSHHRRGAVAYEQLPDNESGPTPGEIHSSRATSTPHAETQDPV